MAPPTTVEEALARFGHDSFRPGQRAVIDRVLAGTSALAIFPTGSGKSLCYQLPAIMLPGLVVVVSPLIALMKDQIDGLAAVEGLRAARLDGTLERGEVRAVFDGLYERTLDLLYVAPERLQNERFRRALERADLSLLVVDEAHCVSEWGHSFRPDYLRLERIAKGLGRPVLGLTATATPAVQADMARAFAIAEDDVICTGFRRENLALSVQPIEAHRRFQAVTDTLRSGALPAVVYVTKRSDAEDLSGSLSAQGFNCEAYHAGLDAIPRAAVQGRFMAGETDVVCATIAFGMGVDKSDLRTVVHAHLPRSLEGYYQEVGRAGRDGEPARAVLLATATDEALLRNYPLGKEPALTDLRGIVGRLAELGTAPGDSWTLSSYQIANGLDVDPLVVKTLLARMELRGEVEPRTSYFSERKWALHVDTEAIAARFDDNRAAFLRRVFGAAKRGRTWATLDLLYAADSMQEPVERIEKALGFLEEKGWIDLRAARPLERYEVLQPLDPAVIAEREHAVFAASHQKQADKVSEVLAYARDLGVCRTLALLRYFGEASDEACGHCDVCAGQAQAIPAWQPPPLGDAGDVEALRALMQKHPQTPARQAARVLCGVWTPAMRRFTRLPAWKRLADRDFTEVLAWVESV